MIDTLKIRLHAPSYRRDCDIDWDAGTTNCNTGLRSSETRLFRAGNKDIVGVKAYHNGEDFNLSIAPRKNNRDIVDAKVRVSVPIVASGRSNFAPTDKDGFVRVLGGISERLRSIGVDCDVYRSHLSRTDLFTNPEMDFDTSTYHPLLAAMTPQRMKAAEYGTGFRWDNTAQQICLYSKIEEMRIKARKSRRDFDPSLYPSNVLRAEWRMLSLQKSKSALGGAETVSDLMDIYDTLEDIYRANLKKQMFKRDVKDGRRVVTVEEAEAGMRYFKETGERYWMERWWGALPFAELGGAEMDAILEAAGRVAGNRETLRRTREKLQQHKLDAAAVKCAAGNRPSGAELYRELKQKIIGE